jgi:diaminohydroxyphosphoribosylaminopyrimidine deaminase / 5-amino-6-(5-phosphoribosylamino)uracil reductase
MAYFWCLTNHTSYMQRCIAIAQLGAGNVAPNPLVGAVLVYEGNIIGEGYHQKYGEAHAEVNCINSVAEENVSLIAKSILYVSLEPCAHFGKTPPCVDLILKYNIPHVVIGCRDSFEKVNGKGIEKLKAAGVKVEFGILEKECRILNKIFFTFQEKKRPYIILKWAQTNDGFIAAEDGAPIKISNDFANKRIHKLRAETAAILVGKNTALKDNPSLTTRLWEGKNPVRIIIDTNLELKNNFNVFNDEAPTIIINKKKHETVGNIIFYKIAEGKAVTEGIIECLYEQQLNAVIIEGGATTLQYFIDANLWDEAIIITSTIMNIKTGIFSPKLKGDILLYTENIFTDRIDFYKQTNNEFL